MSFSFALGCIPSPAHHVGLGPALHLKALPPPARESYVQLPTAYDQGQVGACTGNAMGLSYQVGMTPNRPTGSSMTILPSIVWAPKPARRFLYWNARRVEGTTGEDAGAMLSDVGDEAHRIGFPKEQWWPYPDVKTATAEQQLAAIIERPSWNAYSRAFDQQRPLPHRIVSRGAELLDDLARALSSGATIPWGTQLDAAFQDLGPNDTWPGVTGAIEGGHAMVLHAHQTLANGRRRFKTRSSWDDWCDAGSAWVDQDAILAVTEFWSVLMVDPYGAGE